jgi:hypothetical protein
MNWCINVRIENDVSGLWTKQEAKNDSFLVQEKGVENSSWRWLERGPISYTASHILVVSVYFNYSSVMM